LGFWIGFGWETQNPKKIQKSKKSKIQTQILKYGISDLVAKLFLCFSLGQLVFYG
jgi:hypothetical protein